MKLLKLVAVTKNRSIEEINKLLKKTSIKRIAENRLEEAEKKFKILNVNLEKHYIGKLQSRKIKKICELFDVIESVENLEQAKKIAACGKKRIMIQVNISGKAERSGVAATDFEQLKKEVEKIQNLELIGVMGMATQDSVLARNEFKELKKLQGTLEECSMGMSSDWIIAVEEGSTMLRLGKILFEEGLPTGLKYE